MALLKHWVYGYNTLIHSYLDFQKMFDIINLIILEDPIEQKTLSLVGARTRDRSNSINKTWFPCSNLISFDCQE
jgi:hypothetical protein